MIGHEGPKNLWLLRGNVPVLLVASHVDDLLLQSSVKNATIATLTDANRYVALAHQNSDEVKLRFPMTHLKWEEIALLTVTDASFSNEAKYRSQQGRFHFVTDIHEAKDPKNTVYRVLPLSFGSTTIRRVCRSTLQAETYSSQHGLEAGDKLGEVNAELKGQIWSRQKWEEDSRMCIPHLAFTDYRSLPDHLVAEIPARVQDKPLGIELTAMICKTKAHKQGSSSHLAGFLQFLRKIAPKREQPFTKVAAKLVALQMRHCVGVVQSCVQLAAQT